MDSYPSSAGFWRLAFAAKVIGMSPYKLARSCERGEIPVTVVRLGPHLRFVNASEFSAYLSAQSHTRAAELDLFK